MRGQQADQVRIPRQPCVDTLEGVSRHRRPTHLVQPLQQPYPQAGAGQVGGRDQAVMPAADHHSVEIRSRIGGHESASQISRPDVDSRERIRVSEFRGLCPGPSVRF